MTPQLQKRRASRLTTAFEDESIKTDEIACGFLKQRKGS